MKVKVKNISVGLYDVDSISVNINCVDTQVCFPKKDNVIKYKDKEIELIKKDGIYILGIRIVLIINSDRINTITSTGT